MKSCALVQTPPAGRAGMMPRLRPSAIGATTVTPSMSGECVRAKLPCCAFLKSKVVRVMPSGSKIFFAIASSYAAPISRFGWKSDPPT